MKPKKPLPKPTGSIEINGVKYDVQQCADIIAKVLDVVGGKWKVLLLYHLTVNEVCRFGELQRKIPAITRRMLTLQLREMEKDGLVTRKIYPQIPPKVEYSITEEGQELRQVYRQILFWGAGHLGLLHKAGPQLKNPSSK